MLPVVFLVVFPICELPLPMPFRYCQLPYDALKPVSFFFHAPAHSLLDSSPFLPPPAYYIPARHYPLLFLLILTFTPSVSPSVVVASSRAAMQDLKLHPVEY